jgi:hypothetical protein
MQSTLNIAAADLSRNSQQAKLDEANEASSELEGFEENVYGKILLLIMSIVGLIFGILRAVRNRVLKALGLSGPSQDSEKPPAAPQSAKS